MLGGDGLTISFNGMVTEMVITDELTDFKKYRMSNSTKLAANM